MNRMRLLHCVTPALAVIVLSACQRSAPEAKPAATAASVPVATGPSDAELLAQGEYMVRMGGCNDCHTPGYADKGGEVPKDQWLTGDSIGFHGPWGTTYPANLRLKLAEMDEAAWLKYSAELHTRPIMPDFQLRAMKEQDRLSIFRFIKSLGPAGQPAPAFLPPDRKPKAPYWDLVLPPGPPPPAPAAG